MPFQSTVNLYNTIGFPGDLAYDGPMRAAPYNLYSNGQAQIVGYAFTIASGANPDPLASTALSPNAGTAQVGGTGIFGGILVNNKELASYGTTGAPLAPTLTVPDYTIGSLLTMGQIFVALPAAANVGDLVYFDNTSGALGSIAPTSQGTGVISTTTLTISAFVTGSAPFGVGSEIKGANVAPGTYITALGTGTGGNGTYTVNVSQTAASAAVTAAALAPTGKTFIVRCTVDRITVGAAGVAVIKITQ